MLEKGAIEMYNRATYLSFEVNKGLPREAIFRVLSKEFICEVGVSKNF